MFIPRKKTAMEIFIPESSFRIHPDRSRTLTDVPVTKFNDELWLLDWDTAYDRGAELASLYLGTFYEGMLADGTRFLLPVLMPVGEHHEGYLSLLTLAFKARHQWVSVKPDLPFNYFRNTQTESIDLEPQWANDNFHDLVLRAFGGRYVTDEIIDRHRSFRQHIVAHSPSARSNEVPTRRRIGPGG